ncbi:hypothetical protein LIP84_14725 [Roseburia faecis]|jgi:hypothetical protein|uniref:hypothetical protein n=1 Tax=Roseburia faecis TaxID=301302 RepID=UPI001D001CC1|nr:hypothetical protein [Roseburia faecis]MCB5479456.1 hypothetical protein [Roseburia faecis]
MKREDLIAMGLSEENADKIMADYGSSVQKAKAMVDEYKTKADKAEELQKQLDDIEQGKLTEVEQANKNLEKANARIAELEKAQAIATQRANAASKFNVTAEQAAQIVKDDGSFDYDVLGKIISEKETAAAQAKEQEIAKGSTNPGGGAAGGDEAGTDNKTNAEKIAESLISNAPKNNDVLSHYIQQ